MATINIFQYAAKHKLRFPYKGGISVESLYELSVEELDKIYKSLKRLAKAEDEESLLEVNKTDKELEIKIEIIKDIVAEKQAAADKAKKASETKARKQRIMEAIAKKDEEAMDNASKEELQAMLDALSDDGAADEE
jgi:hypothetical protein